MKMNYYAEALVILEGADEVVTRKLLVKIAQQRPGVVIRAYNGIARKKTVDEQILKYIKANPNQKINCIKFCRSISNEGLREAKAHVERLMME